jgi:hypothetical protein
MNTGRRTFMTTAATGAALAGFDGEALAQERRGRGQSGLLARYPPIAYVASPPGTAWFAPRLPAYPQPIPDERLINDARILSDALERHIRLWLAGQADAVLPQNVMPPGYNRRDYPVWRLMRPEDIVAEDQWPLRPAHPIVRDSLVGSFPDPNCTYLVSLLYAPFGAKVVMEGQFPHARFFDLQITPSFDPKSYHYDGWAGIGEVPIVDVDIEPLPGHVNPFRVGARRDAPNRNWRCEFDLAIGDPVALNAAFRPPFFRAPGNKRTGGAILHQGPWGDANSQGHKRGRWNHGQMWVRYYRPDDAKGPLGGVALPKMWYEFSDGQRFWLQFDPTNFKSRAGRRVKPRATSLKPMPLSGPETGWTKQAGIFRAIYSGFAIETKWGSKEYVRLLDKGVVARGSDLPAPNNYEQSATSCTYIDYLVRGMQCEAGRVVVLTGKLPTFPRTRAGAARMEAGEMRYWSLTGYVVPEGWDMLAAVTDPMYPAGLAAHCVMDEDIVLQADRRFVIALSRPEDRPNNANENAGVTWADWGLAGNISWTLRWMTVGPEWTAPNAPTPQKLGRRAEWAEESYDPRVIPNGHDGALGPYAPRITYLSRAAFEALGPQVDHARVPVWRA